MPLFLKTGERRPRLVLAADVLDEETRVDQNSGGFHSL